MSTTNEEQSRTLISTENVLRITIGDAKLIIFGDFSILIIHGNGEAEFVNCDWRTNQANERRDQRVSNGRIPERRGRTHRRGTRAMTLGSITREQETPNANALPRSLLSDNANTSRDESVTVVSD